LYIKTEQCGAWEGEFSIDKFGCKILLLSGHISRMEAESRHLRHIWEAKLQTYDYQAMLKSRAALPMAAVKDQLLSKIKENEVLVVGGETGCGKTTQVCIHILV
jgi:HrpA-like RNA helicase